jgi:predicted nucleic acid-binding protein
MKIFLDTNILIDVVDSRREGHDSALLLLSQDMQFLGAADSILTMRYIFRKVSNNDILETLIALYDIVEFVDTKAEIVREAVQRALTTGEEDIEDLAKLLTAEKIGCDLFVTSDTKINNAGFEVVPMLSPDDVLLQLGYSKNLAGEWESPDVQQDFYSYTIKNENKS